ncbi:MAG: heavy metal translocating P-type ATPase metal-binding domain-containing protein [Bacteroidota bacterium]
METLTEEKITCAHCGSDCLDTNVTIYSLSDEADKYFCCEGCKTVYEILAENGMCSYYDLSDKPGIKLNNPEWGERFAFLDNEAIAASLLDFSSPTLCRITFAIPTIHCSSCIWLLENLYKLREGIQASRVNFLKKELALSFDPRHITLRQAVELLAKIGYEPHLSLQEYNGKTQKKANHSIILKIGVTGFCAGNIMILSLGEYFGLSTNDQSFRTLFSWLTALLSLPVFFYGASGYLLSAYQSLRERIINIDVPISLGIITLFGRSLYETLSHSGPGYWDSLSGLVLFLLVGKWVQARTYENLSFERNYQSYFPLAATIVKGTQAQSIPVSDLQKNDRIRVFNQGLVVADSQLLSPLAQIDYSFVTGESEPVEKKAGDLIYAGGRQMGAQIELLVQKPASQSYLTGLWNNEAFDKEKTTPVTRLASQFSRWFTFFTLTLAACTAIFWFFTDQSLMWNAFTAVLMVACPCALSLSMPFTMGTAMGIFGRNHFYVKNPAVIQHLATISHIVFDKTGTLTQARKAVVQFVGLDLRAEERQWVASVAAQSSHPLSRKICEWLGIETAITPTAFRETAGQGIEVIVQGRTIRMGSAAFAGPEDGNVNGGNESQVFLTIDYEYRGHFAIQNQYRAGLTGLMKRLKKHYQLSLLSGDRPVDQPVLEPLFGEAMHFRQTPEAKLSYVQVLQESGAAVLMVGDGLNDAGALKQSDVGLVLTDDVNTFFPACDALLDASRFNRLPDFIRFSRVSVNIVKASFLVSLVYNFVGLSWAVSGHLSPVIAAILMPVSSLSVVLFSVGATHLYGKRMCKCADV